MEFDVDVQYSETVIYRDIITFTEEQIKDMMDEFQLDSGISNYIRRIIELSPRSILEAVGNTQRYYDYLSDALSFNIVDSDNFDYNSIRLIKK